MNIRNFILAIFSFICFGATAYPNFSLHNKSAEMIYVSVTSMPSNPAVAYERTPVDPNDFYDDRFVDLNKINIVTIYNRFNTVIAKARFPRDKTIYINFDSNLNPSSIYPQRGKLKGLTGNTEQGYPLKNNVTASDIQFLPANS
jgi:hypothetical protein